MIETTALAHTENLDEWMRKIGDIHARYAKVISALAEVDQIAGSIGITPPRFTVNGSVRHDWEASRVQQLVEEIDAGAWSSFASRAHLIDMLDTQGRKEFYESLRKDRPKFSHEAVLATYNAISKQRGEIFMRGLINVMRSMNWDYKTNQPFKLETKIVRNHIWSRFADGSLYGGNSDAIDDLNRVFAKLDGKPEPETLYHLVWQAREKHGVWHPLGPYMEIKSHKNANGHIKLLRPDLVDEINRLMAKRYPYAMTGTVNRTARQNYSHDVERDANFFETPPAVIERMVELAPMEAGMHALEPSAGEGAIVKELLRQGCVVTSVEFDYDRHQKLKAIEGHEAISADFLDLTPQPIYDRVFMNPPFSGQRDIMHVMNAYDFLKPGGKLVAVMSAGVEFSATKLAEEFRLWLDERGGRIHALPAGSFKDSGTMVNAVLVEVEGK
jgi:hypothetical protein